MGSEVMLESEAVVEIIEPSKLSNSDVLFLCQKTFQRILSNENKLEKGQICDMLRDLEATLSQYS